MKMTLKSIDEEHVTAVLEENGDLTLTGVKSTWNGTKHEPVKMVVTTTDAGGIETDVDFYIWVDGAPVVTEAGAALISAKRIRRGDGAADVLSDLSLLFEDPEGTTISASDVTDVTSSNVLCARATIAADAVNVNPRNSGCSTTITVYAKSAPALDGTGSIATPVDRDDDEDIDADDGDTQAADGELPGDQYGTISFEVTVIP